MDKRKVETPLVEPDGRPGKEEKPIRPEIYPVIDNDLARDNLENDLTAADLQDPLTTPPFAGAAFVIPVKFPSFRISYTTKITGGGNIDHAGDCLELPVRSSARARPRNQSDGARRLSGFLPVPSGEFGVHPL